MDPTVIAAWIAAGVSALTLFGTLAAQYFGSRATSRELARTFAEGRTRTLNERFATAAEQLGSDKPASRLAGVYAMAGLADDWTGNRQTCVDVLCAYLRIPYEPDPGETAPEPLRLAFLAGREVRRTVIRVIITHLRKDAALSWQGLNLDFSGVLFDGGDFHGAQFSGVVSFGGARFSGGIVDFDRARFPGGDAIYFGTAEFSGSTVIFTRMEFSGGVVDFNGAEFSGGKLDFRGARFTGGEVDFSEASDWSHPPVFPWTGTPPLGVKLPENTGSLDFGNSLPAG
jgi:uncharacterized protein YjbI with pentapeptide repeats